MAAEWGPGGEEEDDKEKQEERVESVDVSCLTIFRCGARRRAGPMDGL